MVCKYFLSVAYLFRLIDIFQREAFLLCWAVLFFCCYCSVAKLCPTLWDPMDSSTPGFPSLTVSRSLLKLVSIESVMASNHLILCRPLLLLPSIFPSIRVYSNESVLHIRWPKYWSFSFSISPSDEYLGLISFSIAWFDLLAVQVTVKNLLQHHSSKASILLQCSAFFMVQLAHPYVTTRKISFVGKVMSLFHFNEFQFTNFWIRVWGLHLRHLCLHRDTKTVSATFTGTFIGFSFIFRPVIIVSQFLKDSMRIKVHFWHTDF